MVATSSIRCHCMMAAFICFGVAPLAAQHALSVVGGPGLSTVATSYTPLSDKELLPGYVLGMEYRREVRDHFSIAAGLMLESKGFKLHVDAIQTMDQPPLVESPDFRVGFTYVALPLTARWTFGTAWYGVLLAGLAPAYAVSTSCRIPLFGGAETNHALQGERPLKLDDHSKWDLDGIAGICVGSSIDARWDLELQARYLHGFLPMRSQYLMDNYAMYNRSTALLMSVVYRWGAQ